MKRRGRMLAPVAVILFTCSAVAALQEQRGTDPSMDLARFVNGERLAQQLPGLAAVIVRSDGPPRVARVAMRIATRVATAEKSD
jgi:hypothetical protein